MREVAADGPWAGKLAGAAGACTTMESAEAEPQISIYDNVQRFSLSCPFSRGPAAKFHPVFLPVALLSCLIRACAVEGGTERRLIML
jgi:hypothetical protein